MSLNLINPAAYALALECQKTLQELIRVTILAAEMGWSVQIRGLTRQYEFRIIDVNKGETIGMIRKKKFYEGVRELHKCL